MRVKERSHGFGSVIRVGNVWYPDTKEHKKTAQEMRAMIYKAFITEKNKMERVYRPTGKPRESKLKWKNK